jgi:hypothetical protein
MSSRIELPRTAWNDRLTKIQIAKAMSGKIIVRLDSLAGFLDVDKFRGALDHPDATWATLATIKTTLSALYMRREISHEHTEGALVSVSAAVERFEKALPPKKYLRSERQIVEKALSLRFNPLEIKEDLLLLEKSCRVFYNVVSAPIQKLYDSRDALRRAMSERKLIQEANDKAALLRRSKTLPDAIEHATRLLAADRTRINRLLKRTTEREAHLAALRVEEAEVAQKLRVLGKTIENAADE